jgi:hypothetical protein
MFNVDGTFRLITEGSKGLSTGDLVAIIVAIISLIGVIATTIYTNITTKKINTENNRFQQNMDESSKELQKSLNQKDIDADLKAKARIEWIQKVRGTTAELSALYFRILNEKDKEKLLDIYTESQEKNGLLILFFGHENKVKPENKTTEEILFNPDSNDNKNDMVVKFLSDLSNNYYVFYRKVIDDTLDRLEDIRKMRLNELYNNATDFEEYIEYDPDGNEYCNKIPIPSLEDEKSHQEAVNNIREYAEFSKKLENGIVYLRDIMRIYLKIEWNKAKEGE